MPEPPPAPAAPDDVYARLAPIYDLIYGVTLAHGRREAIERLAPCPGESILEVGVGTALSAIHYPRTCRVVGIDLSPQMLERAQARLTRRRVRHVTLCRMDAAALGFSDAGFDAVYAPYVINVVPDPVAVVREMLRVCRPTGRIVFLNHFDQADGSRPPFDRLLGRLAARIGVNWNVNLEAFLADTGLVAASIDSVNIPRVSAVVVCHKRDLNRSRLEESR